MDLFDQNAALAVTKGCDGAEADNMDGYDNDSGFVMGAIDQLAFNRFVANGAHERGLTVALENDGAQVDDLVDYFDASLNEQCHELGECGDLAPFTAAGKPILNADYPGSLAQAEAREAGISDAAAAAQTRTLLLPLLLDAASASPATPGREASRPLPTPASDGTLEGESRCVYAVAIDTRHMGANH